MLTDHKEPANSEQLLLALVGEKIKGVVLSTTDGRRLLVFESGHSFWFNTGGAFGAESKSDTQKAIQARRATLERMSLELQHLTETAGDPT